MDKDNGDHHEAAAAEDEDDGKKKKRKASGGRKKREEEQAADEERERLTRKIGTYDAVVARASLSTCRRCVTKQPLACM